MFYWHSKYLPNVWHSLYRMIEENYNDGGSDTAIIMGIYVFCEKQKILSDLPKNINKVIVYQTEPLVDNHWHTKDKIIENLKTYDEVWEFDYDNYELLLKNGINAKFKPVKYTSSLKKINSNVEQDIDILFYGTLTEHRSKFLDYFFGKYICRSDEEYERYRDKSFVMLNGIDDKRLDEFISRSKIILNLQPHKQMNNMDRQSQVRIFYPLINGKCIVSEKSARNYFGNCIIEMDNPQQFGEIVMDLLMSGDWKNYPNKCSDYQKFINREILL